MEVYVGSYTGNGSSQNINVPFSTVKSVLIRGGSSQLVWCSDTMGSNATKPLTTGTALQSGMVTSLGTGQFSVGSANEVNANGTVYHFVVFGTGVVTGHYTGTGSAGHTISTVGFAPEMLIIGAIGGDLACFKTAAHPSNGATRWDGGFGNLTNIVTSINSDGFVLGSNNLSNGGSGREYDYLAVPADTLSKALGYTGDGNDDRAVTGAGFEPQFTLVRNLSAGQITQLRFKDQSGDTSFPATAAAAASNRIQAFQSDGFEIGTDATVNTNSDNYASYSLREPAAAATNKGAFFNLF